MNEAEARAEHIDPALQAAGWGRRRPFTANYVLDLLEQRRKNANTWDLSSKPSNLGQDRALDAIQGPVTRGRLRISV